MSTERLSAIGRHALIGFSDFYLPRTHLTLSVKKIPSSYRIHILYGKTRMAGIQSGEGRMMIDSVVGLGTIKASTRQTLILWCVSGSHFTTHHSTWAHKHSEPSDLKMEQINQKFKTLAYRTGVWPLNVQLGPPTLRYICPIGAPKVRRLKKRLHRSNLAVRGQIAFKFLKMVLCGSQKAAELSKLTYSRIQDGGRCPNFQCTGADIFVTAKPRDFIFGVRIDEKEYFWR